MYRSIAFIQQRVRESRKFSCDDEGYHRYLLTQVECRKLGVKFLPRQVMRPILRRAELAS